MTSTIVSWALTLSLVGVGVYYYKPSIFTSIASSPQAASPSVSEPAERPANKRSRSKKSQVSQLAAQNESAASSSDGQSSRKRKIANTSRDGTSTARTNAEPVSTRKDDVELADREFAQQLAKTQAGTNLQQSADQKATKRNKAPNQPHSASFEVSGFSTETSSTTGRDADDDLTPAESPQVHASNGPPKAGDISDMLEAPTAKPTTLRLTGISNEKPKKKPAPQPFEQVLTKKQRQAQAKKEELRLMKEESDRIHEAKKQEQLRRARMASGTSNQTKANNFVSSSGNAWQSAKGSDAVKAAPPTSTAPLLDTFEPSSNNISQPHGAVHTTRLASVSAHDATELKREVGAAKAGALGASTRERALPTDGALAGNISEEDQMQLLKEQEAEDAWESVTTKKGKKKTKIDESEAPPTSRQAVSAPKVSVNGTKVTGTKNNTLLEPETNNRFGSFQDHRPDALADAEWEA